jgi:hypothetical protein
MLKWYANIGLDHGVGHPVLSGLLHSTSRRPEGCRRYLHGCQDRRKHRPRLLPEEPLRCSRPVCPREKEVVNRGQTGPLSDVVEPAQLMVPQREIPVAPFHIGVQALEHLRERFGLVLELVLLHWAQRPKRSIRLKQRDTEALGQRTPWLSCGHRPRRGHAMNIR